MLLGSLLSGLLGSLLGGLLSFLGSRLLSLFDLLGLLNLSCLELSSSLASGLSLDNGSGGESLPEGKLEGSSSLGGINLVVGHNILEDGLAGRTSPLLEGLDGGEDHGLEWRMGSGLGDLLGLDDLLGGSSVSHCVCVGVVRGCNCPH